MDGWMDGLMDGWMVKDLDGSELRRVFPILRCPLTVQLWLPRAQLPPLYINCCYQPTDHCTATLGQKRIIKDKDEDKGKDKYKENDHRQRTVKCKNTL